MLPGYNTTETSSALWSAARSAVSTPSRTRGRQRKADVVHLPEFENASLIIEDPFWRDILKNCSRKKFPRGFSYSNGCLNHRGKNISIELPDDSQAFAFTAIYFFQENGKLYSKRDQELRRTKDEQNIIDRLVSISNSWTCVARSKNHRSTHVRDYVDRVYGHLSQNIRDEIYTHLNLGFEEKYITKEHVEFENGRIEFIDGVDANETRVFWTRPFPQKKLSYIQREEKSKDKCYRHYENWCKYLEDYRKFLVTSVKPSHTIQTSSHVSDKYTVST